MITPRNLWCPLGLLMMSAGLEIIAIELVKAAARQSEFLGRGFGFELTDAEASQHVTDQRSGTAVCQLYFFIAPSLAELGDSVPQTPWDFSLCC